MFRTVPLSIIRILFIVPSAMVYVIQVYRQPLSRTRWSCSKAVYKLGTGVIKFNRGTSGAEVELLSSSVIQQFPCTKNDETIVHVVSGFRRCVNEIVTLVGCYAALIGSYRGADKSLARPTSRCILFDG